MARRISLMSIIKASTSIMELWKILKKLLSKGWVKLGILVSTFMIM